MVEINLTPSQTFLSPKLWIFVKKTLRNSKRQFYTFERKHAHPKNIHDYQLPYDACGHFASLTEVLMSHTWTHYSQINTCEDEAFPDIQLSRQRMGCGTDNTSRADGRCTRLHGHANENGLEEVAHGFLWHFWSHSGDSYV